MFSRIFFQDYPGAPYRISKRYWLPECPRQQNLLMKVKIICSQIIVGGKIRESISLVLLEWQGREGFRIWSQPMQPHIRGGATGYGGRDSSLIDSAYVGGGGGVGPARPGQPSSRLISS